MKNLTVDLIRKILPEKWRPVGYLHHLVWSKTNGSVRAGCFRDMKYVDYACGSVCSQYIPKILGIYEKELESYIEKATALGFQQIVNVGGGEGYYAVGMAFRNPSASIVTFEMEAKGRDLIAQMAKLNSVEDRIEILGKCEPKDLNRVLSRFERNLIVMDVEAYEMVLLDPDRIPALKNAFILVELHDFIQPGIAEEIKSRFASTHLLERVWQTERSLQDFPFNTLYTRLLPKKYLEGAVSERRPARMSWYWIEPEALLNRGMTVN
jgi:hypothetical protein